MTNVHKDVEEN